jgi:dihydroorotate dehydrogenase electron transfer subunit
MTKIAIETTEVRDNKRLNRESYLLTCGPFSKAQSLRPGQFVHVKLDNGSAVFFRRAFSVYDVDQKNKSLSVLFKIMGRGTSQLSKIEKGNCLSVMGPLGNGFRMPPKRKTAILAGGGIGMPPLYFLAKTLVKNRFDPDRIQFFYGGRTKDDLIGISALKKLGIKIIPSTDDGSFGRKGTVTDALSECLSGDPEKYTIYACGPIGMLKAVDDLSSKLKISGQLSLEAPMPCGIGICLGCVMPLRMGGYTRVCREGPVYDIGEVLL